MTTTAEKIKIIREYAEEYDFGERRMAGRWFITNFAFPDLINLRSDFDRIFSIEEDIDAYYDAQYRTFDHDGIVVMYGPFSAWSSILNIIAEPCLFWLQDGPTILNDVEVILRTSRPHVILIDGHTQSGKLDILMEDYMRRGFPESTFEILGEVIRIAPVNPEN